MKYTVAMLIDALRSFPPDAEVVMCMDWTELPEEERPSQEQWEDYLGDLALSRQNKRVTLLNEHFR